MSIGHSRVKTIEDLLVGMGQKTLLYKGPNIIKYASYCASVCRSYSTTILNETGQRAVEQAGTILEYALYTKNF